MENTTKNRILNEALIMFAEKGYKGATLRELAARLKLTKSALYKHYKSKYDIWNAMLDKMEIYYASRIGTEEHPLETPRSGEKLLEMSMGMIRFTVCDPQIILTRKLLITEQFHDPRVCSMATRYFLEGMKALFSRIFEKMMDCGIMPRQDAGMLAFSYTAPISALIHFCDRAPERRQEAFDQMEAFIRFFIAVHGIKEGKEKC